MTGAGDCGSHGWELFKHQKQGEINEKNTKSNIKNNDNDGTGGDRMQVDAGGGAAVSRRLGPRPASVEGLCWLARVGPAPIDAWTCAMGGRR